MDRTLKAAQMLVGLSVLVGLSWWTYMGLLVGFSPKVPIGARIVFALVQVGALIAVSLRIKVARRIAQARTAHSVLVGAIGFLLASMFFYITPTLGVIVAAATV